MANLLLHKRSSTPADVPTAGQLTPGELAINTNDGKVFLKTDAAAILTLGDVAGPASATDNALARFDGTTGKLIQNSAATLTDAGNLTAANLIATVGVSGPTGTFGTGIIAPSIAIPAQLLMIETSTGSTGIVEQLTSGDIRLQTQFHGGIVHLSAENASGTERSIRFNPDGALFPQDSAIHDLGTSTKRWDQIHCQEILHHGYMQGEEISSPSTPATNNHRLFWDTDNSGHLTTRDDAGTEVDLEAGGGNTAHIKTVSSSSSTSIPSGGSFVTLSTIVFDTTRNGKEFMLTFTIEIERASSGARLVTYQFVHGVTPTVLQEYRFDLPASDDPALHTIHFATESGPDTATFVVRASTDGTGTGTNSLERRLTGWTVD